MGARRALLLTLLCAAGPWPAASYAQAPPADVADPFRLGLMVDESFFAGTGRPTRWMSDPVDGDGMRRLRSELTVMTATTSAVSVSISDAEDLQPEDRGRLFTDRGPVDRALKVRRVDEEGFQTTPFSLSDPVASLLRDFDEPSAITESVFEFIQVVPARVRIGDLESKELFLTAGIPGP